MKIPVVDENDSVLKYKERNEVKREEIYRVSALWITDSSGQILLARRAYDKSHHPGMWGPAVAGTVEEESYEENIIKEAFEELGLKDLKFEKGPKTRTKVEYNHFTQWFIVVVDKEVSEFKIQEEEVAEIKWWSEKELKKALLDHP
jgi:isopentenyldiphosphate isomerase